MWAGYWDVYSHSLLFSGGGPPLNPAHLTLVASATATLLASSRLRGVNPGYRAAFLSVVLELMAGVWNEVTHQTTGDLNPISPPHALLVVGMVVTQAGLIAGFTCETGLFHRDWYLRDSFTTLWLAVSGASIYVAGVLTEAGVHAPISFFLAFSSVMTIIPAALVGPPGTLLVMLGVSYPANLVPFMGMGGTPILSAAPIVGLGLGAGPAYEAEGGTFEDRRVGNTSWLYVPPDVPSLHQSAPPFRGGRIDVGSGYRCGRRGFGHDSERANHACNRKKLSGLLPRRCILLRSAQAVPSPFLLKGASSAHPQVGAPSDRIRGRQGEPTRIHHAPSQDGSCPGSSRGTGMDGRPRLRPCLQHRVIQ